MRGDGGRAGVVGMLLLAVACGRSDPPHLKASPLPSDAGAGAFRFQLRNVGGRLLDLDGVAPACGCGVTSTLPASLAPGASTILDVQCRGGQPAGPTVRGLRVRSNDPLAPTTVLTAALPATAAPAPDPAAVYLGYVRVGESAVRDVVLPPTVAIEALPPSSSPDLALESMPARPEGARGVRVRFTPRAAGVVRTTLDLGPAVGALPVVAVAHEGVLAFPAEIGAGADLPTVVLMAIDDPLAIAGVEYPPGVAGEVRTVVPGRQFRLALRGRAGVGGAIRVRRDGGAPLVIPVVGPTTASPTAPRA